MNLHPEILLHPGVPKPLHGLAPRVVLGKAWWDKERAEAYKLHDYHCFACGCHQDEAIFREGMLEAHEFYTIDYKAKRVTYHEAVALCHACHGYIHSGRLTAMAEKGEVSESKWLAVIEHGDAQLASIGESPKLAPTLHRVEDDHDWPDWRLVVFGKEYGPAFKTFVEWDMEFNGLPRNRKK